MRRDEVGNAADGSGGGLSNGAPAGGRRRRPAGRARAARAEQAAGPTPNKGAAAGAGVLEAERPLARQTPAAQAGPASPSAPATNGSGPVGGPDRRRRPESRPTGQEARQARPPREAFTAEQAAAIESPREFRLSPDGRRVAYTFDVGGVRQIFLLPVRGGYPEQLTASEKTVSDPQWSPDGRRIAFVKDDAIVMVDVEGPRQTVVTSHPGGNRAPRWAPDGRRLAFVSRRRGWDQVWLVDAPVPRRGRPAARPRPLEPRPITPAGVDVEDFVWSPDGTRMAIRSQRSENLLSSQIHVLDLATGQERQLAGDGEWATGPRWLPDGTSLLYLSDRDGWLQVYRVAADGSGCRQLTSGPRERGDPAGRWGEVPLPSPDGRWFVHLEIHDGVMDLLAEAIPESAARDGAGPSAAAGSGSRAAVGRAADWRARRGVAGGPNGPGPVAPAQLNPFPGSWIAVDWLPDSSAVLAIGESERLPEDLWLLPMPGVEAGRPRQLTHSLPLVVEPDHFASGERIAFTARDGMRIQATLWLPHTATGEGAVRVPCLVHSHGGPTAQAFRDWQPFRQLVVDAGIAFLSVDFRGSTGYGREFRWANRGEWGHADAFDVIDAARWAESQRWCDGRLAHYGGSYGGYLTLCVLVEEPALWRAGIDLFGDSDIAESYRHCDRIGRIDLERMMGSPDDPASAEAYRRGSPLHRAERIEAPLLILHGRKDKRVMPLATERMVEALEIEGKHYQVQWYDDEGHGWQKRDNRRDAWRRCLEFLKRHLLEQADGD